MFKKLVKKAVVAATLVSTLCLGFSFAACNVETDHPEITISVEIRPGTEFARTFNLEYTLYRNMYPNTVRHFITLADKGFYNDTIIHDYQSADWFGGGYDYIADTYAERASANALADYFNDDSSKEQEYMDLFNSGAFDATVFSPANHEALPTLVGEFKSNSANEILQGQFGADVGVLKMYYYPKETTEKVPVKFHGADGLIDRDYKYNCATSIFAMQVSSGSSVTLSDYCVFGRINNADVLNDLVDTVSDSIGDDAVNIGGIYVDHWDTYSNESADQSIARTFRQTSEPIVIRSIKVTKY